MTDRPLTAEEQKAKDKALEQKFIWGGVIIGTIAMVILLMA